MENKKASIDIIHIIVGTLAILGGVLYIVNQNKFGLIIISIGLLAEALANWLK